LTLTTCLVMRGLLGLSQLMSGRGHFQQWIFNRAQQHTHTHTRVCICIYKVRTHTCLTETWSLITSCTTHIITSTMASSVSAENLQKIPLRISFLCLTLTSFTLPYLTSPYLTLHLLLLLLHLLFYHVFSLSYFL